MNAQMTPSPYTPVGAGPAPMGNPPVLGAQVPGQTGGLPALSGLSVSQNPMAQQLQSYGRGDDSMLIHMTPNEVNSLQGLAMASGGSLTINPHTGLPEAGWLGKLLPTLLGVAGAAFGIPTWAMGLGVGAGQTALTGDLSKGLTAGLQAFGGAGLGQAAGVGGKLGSLGADLGLTQSATGAAGAAGAAGAPPAIGKAAEGTLESTFDKTFGAKAPGFLSKFGAETSLGQTGLIGKALPMVAGSSVLGGISDAMAPNIPQYKPEEDKWVYEGAYKPMSRRIRPTATGSGEVSFFDPSNPYPGYLTAAGNLPRGFAEGGETRVAREGDRLPITIYNGVRLADYPDRGGADQGSLPTAPIVPTTPTTPTTPISEGILALSQTAPDNSLMAQLPALIAPYRTGPGPITASRTYAGGSPSERIKADLEFKAAVAKSLAAMADKAQTTAPAATGTPTSTPFQVNDPRIPPVISPPAMGNIYGGYSPFALPFAKGGEVQMRDGSFVVDARTVSELGNGSSNAGIEFLQRLGGRPVRGPGDGVSDSVPARIGGKQEARVARDEVVFPPEAVKHLGGTKKFYALMDKAHKARKQAKRGQDTGVRRGLV